MNNSKTVETTFRVISSQAVKVRVQVMHRCGTRISKILNNLIAKTPISDHD